jgi:hypothetical protein
MVSACEEPIQGRKFFLLLTAAVAEWVRVSIPFAALILAAGVESSSLYMDGWIEVFVLF